MELQRHPAIIEKDYILSSSPNGITLNDNTIFSNTSIEDIIKVARMTFSIIFDLFYPEICDSSIPPNWSPTMLMYFLERYIDAELNYANIQTISTAPIDIPDDIRPWMHITGRMRQLTQFSTDQQSMEIANLTKLRLSKKLRKYDNIKYEINELEHAISDLSNEQVQTLCECILTRYDATWWEDIHSLFSLN